MSAPEPALERLGALLPRREALFGRRVVAPPELGVGEGDPVRHLDAEGLDVRLGIKLDRQKVPVPMKIAGADGLSSERRLPQQLDPMRGRRGHGLPRHQKSQVIVPDLASDPRWVGLGWRTMALANGLKACWSTPILASNDFVLGTFAIYWRKPRSPTKHDEKIVEQITHLAAVAIERKRNEAALEESEERFRLIVDAIPGFVCTLSAEGESNSSTVKSWNILARRLRN